MKLSLRSFKDVPELQGEVVFRGHVSLWRFKDVPELPGNLIIIIWVSFSLRRFKDVPGLVFSPYQFSPQFIYPLLNYQITGDRDLSSCFFLTPRQSVSHLHLYLKQLKTKLAETASDLAETASDLAETASDLAEAARLSQALAEAAKHRKDPSLNSLKHSSTSKRK